MRNKDARRGPHRGTVLLVTGIVGALLIGTAGAAVGASLVTSAKIKNGTIRAVDIKNNTITGKKIRNGTVTSKDIKNGSLTAKDVKASSLTGALVKNGSLTGADLANGTLTGEHLEDGSISTEDLAPTARAHWAVVESIGELARGSEGATSTSPGVGIYEVTFPIDVDECAFSATIGNSASGTPSPGFVTATPLAANDKAVYVRTYDTNGAIANRAFHLVVSC